MKKNLIALLALVVSFLAISLVFVAETGLAEQIDATKEYFGQKSSDFFDQVQMHENTKLWVALMAAISLFGFMAITAVLHMKTRENIEKKVEDELNEVKAFNQQVVNRLLEAISDQQKKDIFQTISQGQAALWKGKE